MRAILLIAFGFVFGAGGFYFVLSDLIADGTTARLLISLVVGVVTAVVAVLALRR